MTTMRDLITQRLDFEALDTGELPEEVVHDTLEGIEGTLSEKVNGIVGLLRSWKASEAACAEEIKRLQDRKQTFARRGQRLKDYLKFQLSRLNDPRIETDLHTVSLRAGQLSVVVEDEDALPDEFTYTETRVDKAALKGALKDGDIPGASLKRGDDYVTIR